MLPETVRAEITSLLRNRLAHYPLLRNQAIRLATAAADATLHHAHTVAPLRNLLDEQPRHAARHWARQHAFREVLRRVLHLPAAQAALAELPTHQAELLRWAYLEQPPAEELAALLFAHLDNLAERRHQARTAVRDAYQALIARLRAPHDPACWVFPAPPLLTAATSTAC